MLADGEATAFRLFLQPPNNCCSAAWCLLREAWRACAFWRTCRPFLLEQKWLMVDDIAHPPPMHTREETERDGVERKIHIHDTCIQACATVGRVDFRENKS